jgi:hypothetical protein
MAHTRRDFVFEIISHPSISEVKVWIAQLHLLEDCLTARVVYVSPAAEFMPLDPTLETRSREHEDASWLLDSVAVDS